MSDRYIRRFALPERLYAASAPVVLAAGVLLEDTRLPRLVAQLKWKSIDQRPLAALTVAVHCSGDDGETVFTYTDLWITRGQTFGVYTAVVLPWGDARRMEVRALSADFTDGTRWTAPEGAVWAPLPAFDALAGAVEDPELLALSAALPRNRYAFWSGQGLWYCPCGGVNREEEAACHRCGCLRSEAERLATPEGLRQVRRERTEEAERLAREEARRREEAQARAEERKEAVRQKLSGLKARFRRGEVPETPEPLPPQSDGEAAPEPQEIPAPAAGKDAGTPAPQAEAAPAPEAPVPASVPAKHGKRKKALGIAAAVVLLAAAGIVFLPRLLGGASLPGISAAPEVHVTAPGDGETVLLAVEEDDDGVCVVTPELVQSQIPGVAYLNLDGVPDMGDDIDAYLVNSFQMAILVSSLGEYGSEGEWGSFDADTASKRLQCLLLYDGNFHLCGHAVGAPKEVENGVWQLEVTLCDYDFTELYEQQRAAFEAQRAETFSNYIAPEDITASGAAYFLRGYNTGRGPTLLPGDSQAYHLWAQYTSPYMVQHSRELDRLKNQLPRGDRWMAYLLLDRDHQLLGYTMMDSTGAGGQVTDADITPLGTVDLYLEEKDNRITLYDEVLQEIIPEEAFFNFEGYAIDLGGDMDAYLTDSFHMAWLVTSEGTAWGGNSSAIWDPSSIELCTLMVYSDFTRLCGYFIGVPEDLGGGQWRLPITLCDYDFSHVYEEQAAGYDDAPQLPEIPESQLEHSGAAWFIEPVQQLSGNDDFTNRVRLQSLWSRGMSPYIRMFARSIVELPHTARRATEDRPEFYLLLNADYQYLGYVRITDGERVANMTFDSVPAGGSTTNTGTVSLDLTADGEYCPVTLEQIQTLVPQARRMEFRGVPDLGSLEEHLKISDNMAFLIASDGAYGVGQTSGRFSVQGGRAPFRALLLYSDDTTLCGYFIGEPSHVGGDTWRMDITLCDYDFSDLYEQQKREFEQASMPRYISQDQAAKSGAAWCISTGYYFSEDSDFTRTTELYGMWSREQSMGKERFCKSAADLEQLRPSSGDNTRAYVLLLDKSYRSIGYTILTA